MSYDEKWMPVKGFENYRISSYGQVRSHKTGRYFRKVISAAGYPYVDLRNSEYKRVRFFVHRLVAEHFIENPHNYPIVMHLDNNPLNSHFNNLKWGTQAENCQQCHREKRTPWVKGSKRPENAGEKSPKATFTNIQVMAIKDALNLGHSLTKIGRYFKTTKGTIWKIKAGYSWEHVSSSLQAAAQPPNYVGQSG